LLLGWLYRVRVIGLEHYADAGSRVLIIANHASFLDAVLLTLFLPDRLTFTIDPRIARLWWVRPFLGFVEVVPIDPRMPFSAKALVKRLRGPGKVVIFPEGRITVTGSLMKIYDGPAFVADRSGAVVLPVRIAGTEATPFSLLAGRVRRRWFPRITLTVLPSQRVHASSELRGPARRREAARKLTDLMTAMMFRTTDSRRTIIEALLDARRAQGSRRLVVEDLDRQPLTYGRLLGRVFVMGDILARQTRPAETVGLVLPGAVATLVTFLALHARGRVPAMLNFTAGGDGMLAACRTAGVETVYTSRRFVQEAKLAAAVERLAARTRVRYLEDVEAQVTPGRMLWGWIRAHVPGVAVRALVRGRPDDPAVVLFTAGSEGVPKGVALSHENLLANRAQIAATIDFGPTDLVLNTLPLFHAFGLTTGTMLPVLSGVRVFFVPSPLDYRGIPEVAYDIGATILFGTNTFLAGYARLAHPYDFHRVRYVFAGAERLEPETRRTWAEKFGIRILEGYGATETGPVLATNTPMQYRTGTVGRLLPGIDHYLEPVRGLSSGGRLCVRGPNVMLGYLRDDLPGTVEPPRTERGDGWYDTGDFVAIDADGFLTIQGRAKRFAKVGGEMVSLAAVEVLAGRTWPESRHAALALPDPRRGEQIVLLTEATTPRREELLRRAHAEGVGEVHVPKKILAVDAIPLLGAGKIDYVAAGTLAEKEMSASGSRAA
jgi:acyl-[acyl-carrier-protein]-phospholipid O-acyltransferase/long-chain-fatty-acid--[acyl-carrier-protein] ligase